MTKLTTNSTRKKLNKNILDIDVSWFFSEWLQKKMHTCSFWKKNPFFVNQLIENMRIKILNHIFAF